MGKATSKYNLAVIHPNVAKGWHPTKNKPLTPRDVTSSSHKKVWWKCKKNHEWDATIASRSAGNNCPECSGKKAGKDNNLQLLHPKIAKEWHPTKNKPLTSKDFTSGSNKKVWWKCTKGHEWESVVQSRVIGGRNNKYLGCPLCSGRKPHGEHNLYIKHLDVAKEWHPTKNKPLTSKDVTPRSNKKVWWKCKKDHEWEAKIQDRSKGNGCPYCSGRYPTQTNNLYVKFPEVVKEWHPTKNKTLTPKDVTPGSKKKVWWKCHKGHEWEATISNRSQGTGCPLCRPNISKIQIQIFCELKTIFKEIFLGKRIDKIECDIYLPKYKIAIEYDGYHWHKENEKKDRKKNLELNKKGVALFRIRERQLKKISLNDVLVNSGEETISVVKKLLNKLFQKHSFSSTEEDQINKYNLTSKLRNIKEYNKLLSYLPGCLPQDSFKLNFPESAKQWNYKRNDPLQPDWFSSWSNTKVWWQCDKGHEWEAIVSSRSRGRGCPECVGKKVGKDNNLYVKFSEVAKEWHPTKNKPLTPKDVASGSGKRVWWKCTKGHEWEATIANRSNRKSGCPECSGYKVGKDNNLQFKFQEVAKEWHPTKNKSLTPKDVTSGSKKKVWWQCNKGHAWEAQVTSRSRGSGCPKCYKEGRTKKI